MLESTVVLTLKGTGESVTLLEPSDILEYVNRYMGPDTTHFISALIARNEDEDREMVLRRDSDLDSYEASLDSNRSAFNDVLALMESIDGELAKNRTNKKKIKNFLDQMETVIHEQI